MSYIEFSALLGQTLVAIEGAKVDSEELIFTTAEGKRYRMHHYQDCCECVYVEDICGDVEDLLNSPIIRAEEASSKAPLELATPEQRTRFLIDPQAEEEYVNSFDAQGDSTTWTFYKLDTRKGGVTIRWNGSSNGYYSESVDFAEITEPVY